MTPFYSQWKCVLMQNFNLKGEIRCHFSVWSFLVSFAAGFSNVNIKVISAWYNTVRRFPPVLIFSLEHLVCKSDPPLGGPESQWVQVVPARAQLPHWVLLFSLSSHPHGLLLLLRCQRGSNSTVWIASFMIACPRQSVGREDKNKKSLSEGSRPYSVGWNACLFEAWWAAHFYFAFVSLLQVPRSFLQLFASSLSHTVWAFVASPVKEAHKPATGAFWPLKAIPFLFLVTIWPVLFERTDAISK